MKLQYLFIVFLILTSCLLPQGKWRSIDSPTDRSLRTLQFVDSLTGWVAGDSCVIFKTTDGGLSWDQQFQFDDYDIKDIFFLDENYGWSVAVPIDFVLDLKTLMLSTTNGGTTWEQEYYPDENVLFLTVFYTDTINGWMAGRDGKIVYTTNSGERWQHASIDTGILSHLDIYKIRIYNDSLAIASGGAFDWAGQVWISRDGGFNWKPQQQNPPDIVIDFHMFDDSHIMGLTIEIESYGSGIFRTVDGGENWTYTNFDIFGPTSTLAFRTPNEVWVSQIIEIDSTVYPDSVIYHYNPIFLYSVDSGYTWEQYLAPDWILKFQFTDSLTGYGVGENGAIVKYSYDSTTTVKDDPLINKKYYLYQNYPNPFNPDSKIKFELADPAYVKLTVFDILGREITTLVDGEKSSGIHEILFTAGDLPSGIYFYKMRANNYSEVRKMLLLR